MVPISWGMPSSRSARSWSDRSTSPRTVPGLCGAYIASLALFVLYRLDAKQARNIRDEGTLWEASCTLPDHEGRPIRRLMRGCMDGNQPGHAHMVLKCLRTMKGF
jgi:hypothetical protein